MHAALGIQLLAMLFRLAPALSVSPLHDAGGTFPGMATPPLEIRLLGGFELRLGTRRVPLDSARVRSLLAFLVLNRGLPQPRRRIAFLFWPDSSEKQARTNLRHVLHQLKTAIPTAEEYLDIGPDVVSWRAGGPVLSDVAAFEESADGADLADEDEAAACLEAAAARYPGDLLPGDYDDWVLEERDRLSRRQGRILEGLLTCYEEAERFDQAADVAQRLLQRDPLAEDIHRRLIRLHAARGDRAQALRAYHRCAEMLERELGVVPASATREAYEAALDFGDTPPAPSTATEGTALIGREREWEALVEGWREAETNGARLVLIAGEAGIGKTRLSDELATWCVGGRGLVARARAYAAEGRPAYAPVIAWLRSEAIRPAVARLEPTLLTNLARLLPELLAADALVSPPEPLPDAERRQQIHDAVVQALVAPGHPMLLVVDDVQWCDPETLALIHSLVRRATPGLLVLATARREEVDPGHPLEAVVAGLTALGRCTVIEPARLDQAGSAALAREIAGRALSEEAADRLHRETEGNPLFVVESLRTGWSDASPPDAASPDGAPTLSPKLRAVIASRLGQLSLPAREIVGLAATIGREFTLDVLGAADHHDEVTRLRALDELWRRRIVREHGLASYDFSHDKIREVAYRDTPPPQRQAHHLRVARALEAVHGTDRSAVAGRLARHYDLGGSVSAAVRWYRWAAEEARRVVAHDEAIRHLARALELNETLPRGPARDEEELTLRMALGPSLGTVRGWATPEAGATYGRARELCLAMGDDRRLFPVLWGLYSYHIVRADLHVARTLGEEMVRLALVGDDSAELVGAHFALGCTLCLMGGLEDSRAHLEEAIGLYDRRRHRSLMDYAGSDLGMFSLSVLSHTLWHLGAPAEALEKSRKAVRLAGELGHRFSEAIAATYAATLHQFRDEPDAAEECARAAIALSAGHGFPYYQAWGTILLGWVESRRGAHGRGVARMREGLAALRVTGAGLRVPYYLALLAEACATDGRGEEALDLVDEALVIAAKTGEHWRDADLRSFRGRLPAAGPGGRPHGRPGVTSNARGTPPSP